MRESLVITGCFVAGVLLGRFVAMPEFFTEGGVALYVLYGLMFLVGVSIGRDRENRTGPFGYHIGNFCRYYCCQLCDTGTESDRLFGRGGRFWLLFFVVGFYYPV